MAKIKNTSGIIPIEYNVIVKPKKVEQKTAGGVILPDELRDQEQGGATRGVVMAIADQAFNYEPAYATECPVVPGDTVIFSRYAGAEFEADDGETYRTIKDKDIIGKVT